MRCSLFAPDSCHRQFQHTTSFFLTIGPLLFAAAWLPARCSRWQRSVFRLLLLTCLIAYGSPVQAETQSEFTADGEIIVVSTISRTVAVEVILNQRPQIVGGKLAGNVVLKKDGRKVDLETFGVGERVTMRWRIKDYRKEILAMTGSSSIQQHQELPSTAQPGFSVQSTSESTTGSRPPSLVRPIPQTISSSQMIGSPQSHRVRDKETLLDIARQYNLGYNELAEMHPEIDPWLPPVGRNLELPTQRLLPPGSRKGILINIPELRLYYFQGAKGSASVITYPIGIGDTDFPTEPGNYVVGNKAINPTWYIPPSLRAKYRVVSIPPGPDNPLGKYWLGLKNTNYGIHGTDIPWSIGRTVTHGCIRMYPEDISGFYEMIPMGTPIEIIYEPVKIGRIGQEIYLEVHRDIYNRTADLGSHARELLQALGYWPEIDQRRFRAAIEQAKGIPVAVGYTPLSRPISTPYSYLPTTVR